jgi:hypothetical protein
MSGEARTIIIGKQMLLGMSECTILGSKSYQAVKKTAFLVLINALKTRIFVKFPSLLTNLLKDEVYPAHTLVFFRYLLLPGSTLKIGLLGP